jgi:hypothetical protein
MSIKLTVTQGKAGPAMPEFSMPAPDASSSGAQPVRPAAIPAPYPETNAKPLFASHFGFTDTNVPVLRRTY